MSMLTVGETLARLRAAGCTVAPLGDRLAVDRPDPATPEAVRAVADLRADLDTVRAVLADVWRYLGARCCRGPRVWCEADRAHEDYRAHGGRLDRATFTAAVEADGRAVLTPGGILAGVGLLRKWGQEDGGTRAARTRKGGAAR